ncbi:MAG: hypothetical protein PHW10_04895 [Candidatus Peribacteraceae bacterium]|nr:hypothetical protein [Candidatus Peribacteraceae bacterium]
MTNKDDDLDEPLSNRKALERADHGKADRREERRKKQELGKLRLDVLKHAVTNAPPSARDADDDKKRNEDVRTRTTAEEEKRLVDNPHTKPDAETMIVKEEQREAAKDQTGYEQAKDQTA